MIAEIIGAINDTVRRMLDAGKPDPLVLAVAIEANQQYYEYLDELIDGVETCASVTVQVDGRTIRFPDIESVAQWITSNK
jgi:hypothetical protein